MKENNEFSRNIPNMDNKQTGLCTYMNMNMYIGWLFGGLAG